MAYTITDVVNYSAAARRRRDEVLQGLDLPYDGPYVALCLYDEARRAGLAVDIIVDEYNSPCDIDIKVGGMPTLMVQGCGAGRSIIIDGETGFPVVDMAYSEWAQIFKEVAASKE